MYWRHFDLSAEPFSLTPDPAFLYLSSVHAEAYAALTIGLRERRGLIAMIGEVGTGKTTLVYSLLSALGPEIHTAYISNARLSFDGILRTALRDFSVECDSVHSTDLLGAFNKFLNQCAEDGSTAAVVIDEAQNLSRDTFEDLRLLTNFETYKHKLLQIVLVGQPELDSKLRDPSLRQVADRIAVRCHVNPLTAHEVRQYLQHRLSAAGGSIEIFSEAAVRSLVHHSRGIPRSINILGHNAMLFAYGAGRTRVTHRDVRSAVRERQGRGLIRFEPRMPRWLSRRADSAPTSRLSYAQLLLGGVAAGLVFFALGASGAKLLRDSGARAVAPAPVVEDSRPSPAARASEPAATQRSTARESRRSEAKVAREANEDDVRTAPRTDAATATAAAKPAPEARDVEAPAERRSADQEVNEEAAAEPSERQGSVQPQAVVEDSAASDAQPVAAPAASQAPAQVAGATQPAAAPQPQASPRPPTASSANDDAVAAAQPAPAPQQDAPSAPAPAPAAEPERVVVVTTGEPADSKSQDAKGAAPSGASAAARDRDGHVGPDIVRVIQVSPGSSLYDLMTNIYGSYDPRYVPRIQAMNPQMTDPNYIMAGDELRFPEDLAEETRNQRR